MRRNLAYAYLILVLLIVVSSCTPPSPPTTPAPTTSPSIPTPQASIPAAPSPPTIDFAANPREGKPPLAVTFTPIAKGDVIRWHWDFGDGQFSDEKTPSHTYTSDGDYTVSLTVSGSGGSTASTKTAYVKVRGTAAINWKDAASCIGQNKVVEGVIVGAHYATATNGKPTFLNFNLPYKGYFTCVIWDSDRAKFVKQFPPNPETYFLNKRVLVKGLIEEYPKGSGTPEIVLKEPSQIEVAEK